MKWRNRRASRNVKDLRGKGTGPAIGGAGVILVLLAGWIFGFDPSFILNSGLVGGGAPTSTSVSSPNRIDDEAEEFVAVVLADTEEVWSTVFAENGGRYVEPTLVLFTGAVSSACGQASSAVGPFYCPGDQQIYLDLDFFRVLEQRLGAGGDFARAYVIAHEVAHHVQNLTGQLGTVEQARRRASEVEANRLTVRLELQADCYSGVWANRAQEMFGVLERGDLREALDAASAIGDDTLQRRSQGYVVPDSFTHGTSEQRMSWFARGFETGDPAACDTFAVREL